MKEDLTFSDVNLGVDPVRSILFTCITAGSIGYPQ
jgi:hypothetical protein